MKRANRTVQALPVVAACLLALAGSAFAQSASQPPDEMLVYNFCQGRCINFQTFGTAGEDTAVVRETSPRVWTISNAAGLEAGRGCEQDEADQVSCRRRQKLEAYFDLFGGSDRLRLRVDSGVFAVFANSGADRVIGGHAHDGLYGGLGSDTLRGRSGADAFDGGPGNDSLDAADGERDRRIQCGDGERDFARIDPIDPRPIGCERVVKVRDHAAL